MRRSSKAHLAVGFIQVDEAKDVRRGGVGGDHAQFVFVTVEHHQVAAAGAEFVAKLCLPLRVGHQRQRPQITLGRLLEIQLGVEFGYGLMGRQFAFHRDLADPRIRILGADTATDEHGHQTETGCANCTVHKKVLICQT
nr:hypothetical protein [Pseudomonas mandelii]